MAIKNLILLLFGASLLVSIVTSLDERRRRWLRPKATALTAGIFFGALVGGATSSLLTRYATEARSLSWFVGLAACALVYWFSVRHDRQLEGRVLN